MTSKRVSGGPARTASAASNVMHAASSVTSRCAIAAGVLAGLAVACAGLAYSGRALANYYSPRIGLFYPLVLALLMICLICIRPRGRQPRFDLLDITLAAFVLLQVLAAVVSPSPSLAWFGAYNRAGGVVLWAALAVLLFVSRRLLGSRQALEPFTWIVSAVIGLASIVAVFQAFGVVTPWRFDDLWAGRSAGTTGNPLNLAGLCLVCVWLGIVAATGRLHRTTRFAAGVASALGLVAIVLSVSRAAYLGLGAAFVFLVVVWVLRRQWRNMVAVAGVVAVVALGTFAYGSNHGDPGVLASRFSADPTAATYGLSQSDVSRGTFWRIGLHAVGARPWLGYGPGAFVVAYRQFVPAATLRDAPLSGVTDPHALPLLVATGSGVPGLIVATAVIVLVAVRGFRLSRPPATAESGKQTVEVSTVTASAAAALALLVFLSVSPGDLTALVPFALMLGLTAGEPQSAGTTLLPATAGRAWAVVWIAALAATVALLALATLAGVQLFRADVAARDALEHSDQASARAADLLPGVATYDLLAWDGAMREAASAGDSHSALAAGERRLQAALTADPTSPVGQIAAVRYHLSLRQVDQALAHVRGGLVDNPSNPLLQGLWGYIAQALARDPDQRARAANLAQALETLPDKSADGYYWLGVAYGALGDKEAEAAAMARAHDLAPDLTPQDYQDRIRGAF